jgi:hypothetical protein
MTAGRSGQSLTLGSPSCPSGQTCVPCRCRQTYRQLNTMLEGR